MSREPKPCPKCGTLTEWKLVGVDGAYTNYPCPLGLQGCLIKSLEQKLPASEARERALQGKLDEVKAACRDNKEWFVALHLDLAAALGMLHRAEGHIDQPAKIPELLLEVKRLVSAGGDYQEAMGKAESERDAALAQVVALRGALEKIVRMKNNATVAEAHIASVVLSNTSATAQQFVEKVRREALENFIPVAVETLATTPNPHAFNDWDGEKWVWGHRGNLEKMLRSAAILGEKEGN